MKNRTRLIGPQHESARNALRIMGPALALTGLVLTVIGIGNFLVTLTGMISSGPGFGDFAFPRYFWCAFVGLPLFGVGLMLTKFGFLGHIARYLAGETVPVAQDAFNDVAEATAPGVEAIARAAARGFSDPTGTSRPAPEALRCPRCQTVQDAHAKYCNQCGSEIAVAVACASCGGANPLGARFCGQCGEALLA